MPETTKFTSSRVEGELDEVLKAAHAMAEEHQLLGSAGYSLLVKQLFNLALTLAHAKHPAYMIAPEVLYIEGLRGLKMPGSVLYVPPPEMDAVLDMRRQDGRECGLQVLGDGTVVSWFGDIQKTLTEPHWRAWGLHAEPAMLFKTGGENAIEDAAKWLRNSANG